MLSPQTCVRSKSHPLGVPLRRFLGALLILALLAAPARAQQRGAPSDLYYSAFGWFYDGNYKDASRLFNTELRGAIKIGPMRWIDSICYYTMIGECYYETGDLSQALECYTAALEWYLAYPDWMMRVRFPDAIQSLGARPPTPWGMSGRPTQLGRYEQRLPMMQGRIDNTPEAKYGGVIQQAFFHQVGVQEIVRCTALAIRRRAELLGPLAKFDPLNKNILSAVSQPIGPRNHWSSAYVDLLLGVALAANDKRPEAAAVLTRAASAAGQFDHPLTATALLELGRLQLEQGNYAGARQILLEATFAAYNYGPNKFPDVGVLEDAFRYASLAHLLATEKAGYGPLVGAAAWAKQKGLRHLHVSLSLSAAEQALTLGQTPQAIGLLTDVQADIGRRPLAFGRTGARLNFLRATALFQQGKVEPGDQALAAAMEYMKRGSHWLFHIAQVDAFVMSNLRKRDQLTPRAAMDLCQEVLRDPQPSDWTHDPMESLAVLMTPHPLALEHWFLVALRRTDRDAAFPAALEIADRVRRHRYFSAMALGGRLQALRWILEAPPDALVPSARLERRNLLVQYPGYKALSEKAREVRAALTAMPMLPTDGEVLRKQHAAFTELANLSLQQEAILRHIAVRREPAALVFPPLRSTKVVQQSLPKGTALLAFFVAGGQLHAFLLNQERSQYWPVKGAALLPKRMAGLLREMGNYDQNRELAGKELNSPQWKESASEILALLLEGSQADFSRKFPELVVVPDGILWYLPFEALTVKVDGQWQPLISRFRIRYAPTMSLSVPDNRGQRLRPDTLVVAGRLHPRDEPGVAQAAFQELAKAAPPAAGIDKPPLPASPSLFKVRVNQLIVLDDLGAVDLASLAWPPIPLDKGKPGSTLSDWLGLPWGGPEVVILPGIQTPAGNGLKRSARWADGSDLFLSVCALLSTGTRTVLMSRWRPGGQSAIELLREFVQEMPNTAPDDAWQRAVLLLAESRLSAEKEPRIKQSSKEDPIKGDHPFFWAGYMLVDPGDVPVKAEAEKPGSGREKPKQPDQPPAPDQAPKAKEPEKPVPPPKEESPEKPAPPAAAPPAKKPAPPADAGKA